MTTVNICELLCQGPASRAAFSKASARDRSPTEQ